MTSTPTLPAARPAVHELELLSLEWRRVQVLLRVRPSGAGADPSRLRLRHDRSGTIMPATGWAAEGDEVVVRFNVMQGPGQLPLAAGRWRLVAGDGHAASIRSAGAGEAAVAQAGAEFPLVDRTYMVRVATSGPGPALVLDVHEGPPRPDMTRDEGRRARVVRLVGRANVAVFDLALAACRRLVRRNGRRILFTSDSRGELGGNMKFVHDRMVERGLDREYEIATLFKPGVGTRRPLADRLRLPWVLARADTIVIDDFQPVIRRLPASGSRIIQLWHAVGAFKTVGYSRVGKPGAPDPFGATHKNYGRAIVSSTADIPVYAEAFGIPESRVVPTGVPRVDPMFDPYRRARSLDRVKELFPATVGRRVFLFAPTFRGHGARSATYDMSRIDHPALHALCVEKDAVCLVRMHPFVRDPLGIPPELGDRLIDASTPAIEPNDLLFAVDLLITDYSSIVYEYSILGRPALFYAWDLDDYVASRDFYEPYESFVPGRIVRTFDELLDAIRREDFEQEKVAPFAARHFDHLDGGSTDRVIELIVSG